MLRVEWPSPAHLRLCSILSLQTLDLSSASIHSLFARLLLANKPLVLHNGWVDLLFLFHTFYSPLPPSVDSFMADLSEIFLGEAAGGVFDTKAIAEYEFRENASFLEYIFRKRWALDN